VPGRADAYPATRLVAGHEFAQGRDIGQYVHPRRRGHCKRAQLAGSDVLDHRTYWSKYNLHLSAEQVGYPTCPIWHVNYVCVGHDLEQFAEHMARGPGTGRGHVDLTRIGLGDRRADHHDEGVGANAGDRRDVANEIETEVLVKRRIDPI